MNDIAIGSPAFFENPYPTYAKLRESSPVHWDERAKRWFITRYDDVVAATSHPGISVARIPPTERLTAMGLAVMEPVYALMRRQMNFIDPPNHTRIRGLVHKAFTPAAMNALRAHIQNTTDELLAPYENAHAMDVIQAIAFPLPAIVIAEILGVSPGDRDQFKKWSTDFAELVGNPMRPMERLIEIKNSSLELLEYLRATVARLRKSPENNIMSELARVEEKGEMLTEDELLANAIFLLVAGHETTTNLIANGLLCLLREPEQMQKLREDPGLLPSAIEEFLRYEGSLQMVGRISKTEIRFGETTIGPGQVIALVLGSANRDPKIFNDPERLDIGRKENRHLAFSVGAHYCLGATLARIEGQIAIGSVLRRFPGLALDDAPLDWHQNLSFRGLRSLNVRF